MIFVYEDGLLKNYNGESLTQFDNQYQIIEGAFVNSPDIEFCLKLLPPMSATDAFRIYKNSPKFSKIFFNFKQEIIDSKYRRILQLFDFPKIPKNIKSLCPIECVISRWCSLKTQHWWLFLFRQNHDRFRIVAGFQQGIYISRFLRITDELDLLNEIYQTFLFIRRIDQIESIQIFTNVPISGLNSEVFVMHKFDENDAINMLLNFAQKTKFYIPVYKKDKFFITKSTKRQIKFLSAFMIICLSLLSLWNFYEIYCVHEKIEEINKSDIKNQAKICGVFRENKNEKIVNFLKAIDNRKLLFNKLETCAKSIKNINIHRVIYKQGEIIFDTSGRKNESNLKASFGNLPVKLEKSNSVKNNVFSKHKKKEKGEHEIIKVKL